MSKGKTGKRPTVKKRARAPSLMFDEPADDQPTGLVAETSTQPETRDPEPWDAPAPKLEPFRALPVEPAAPSPVVAPADDRPMTPTALVFLDNPVARKLAVAWALALDDDVTNEQWIQLAGLEYTTATVRVCKALKAHRVCRPRGVTDDLALKYITSFVVAPLMKPTKRKGANNE